MRFKFKVLIVNIIILSIALGIMGYMTIRMNFRLALDTIIDSSVSENNMIQTYVEYELMEFLNSNETDMNAELKSIGNNIIRGMLSQDCCISVYYADDLIYTNDADSGAVPKDLLDIKGKLCKNYVLTSDNDNHYLYVASCNAVRHAYLQIVTKRSVEGAYSLMNRQVNYYRIILSAILILGCIIIYIISTILTRPLEKLNRISDEMADGKYNMRAPVNSTDEIGQLAAKFNNMAYSVGKHVNELEEQIKRREQFVADFTHEIKTPLTTIIGYADTMRSMELPREDQITSLNYMVSAGKRLETMSRKLFDLIYLNRNDIEMSPVPVDSLIHEISSFSSPTLSAANISLVTDCAPATIVCNRDLLVTAFSNFIDNSRKASANGSRIELNGITDNNRYILSVKDYGIGMKKEHLDKICNEFYMIDKSRSRSEGSAGLGLSLAAIIVNRHNALLQIDSEEGIGTTVSVIFNLPEREVSEV